MNTKALAAVACLWLPVVASAADDQDVTTQLDSLGQKFEKILSTQGISMGGQVIGDFGSSDLSGNGEVPTRRSDETIGFTQVDFDLRARPNTVTQARAVFRLYLDDASFFGAPYTPFETRWLSIDGSAQQGMLYYHLANLGEKWSPFTIWSPDPGFIYTPRLFAQEQQEAMSDVFQGNNIRNLQGFNIGLRASVPNARIDSFDVQVLAAKLLSAAGLGDPESALTSQINWSMDGTGGSPDSLANFDRWVLGARGAVTFLGAFNLGANYLNIKDLKSTFGIADSGLAELPRDTDAVDGNIATIQLGADIGKFLRWQNGVLGLDAELGYSSWQYGHDTAGFDSTLYYQTTTGSAIDVDMKAGWKGDDWKAVVNIGYLSVDSGFRSDLAQSMTFNQALGRIYNTDQDVYDPNAVNSVNNGYTNLLHYNTFDAMYDHVFRYVAENQNEFAKDPYQKLAYTNYVGPALNPSLGQWTSGTDSLAKVYIAAQQKANATGAAVDIQAAAAAKIALYQQDLVTGTPFDRDLQLMLPSGDASPNRVGPKFGFEGSYLNGGLEALLNGYMLQEAKGTVLDSSTQVLADKAKFQQVEAGVKFRLDRFLPNWNTLMRSRSPIPLELSVSAGQTTAKGGTSLDYKSTEVAASAYVGVLPRLSLLGGYQEIMGVDNTAAAVSRNVTDMAGGLEFKIQDGAYLLAMYSLLKTEYPNASEYNFDQSIWSTKISVSF
ncbi:MAG TPA: hypothetical protein VN931_06920 [Fibrobacteria bacterium]|nr:hypothetical protein [Fibrobacteria bacterium]